MEYSSYQLPLGTVLLPAVDDTFDQTLFDGDMSTSGFAGQKFDQNGSLLFDQSNQTITFPFTINRMLLDFLFNRITKI